MSSKDRKQERDIQKVIETISPLIAEHGFGNILMAIAGLLSVLAEDGADQDAGMADKLQTANQLLTQVATKIQLLEI